MVSEPTHVWITSSIQANVSSCCREEVSLLYNAYQQSVTLEIGDMTSDPVYLAASSLRKLGVRFFRNSLPSDKTFTGYLRNFRIIADTAAEASTATQVKKTTLVFICSEAPHRIKRLLEESGCSGCINGIYVHGCAMKGYPQFPGKDIMQAGLLTFVDGNVRAGHGWLLQALEAMAPSVYAQQTVLLHINGTVASSGYNQTVIGMVDFNRGWLFPPGHSYAAEQLDCTITTFNVSKLQPSDFGGFTGHENLCHALSGLGSGTKYATSAMIAYATPNVKLQPAVLLNAAPASPKLLISTVCGDALTSFLLKEALRQGTPFAVRYIRGGSFCDDRLLEGLPQTERDLLDASRHLDTSLAQISILPGHVRHLWGPSNASGLVVSVPSTSSPSAAEADFLLASSLMVVHSTEEQQVLTSLGAAPQQSVVIPLPIPSMPWRQRAMAMQHKVNFLMFACRSESTCDFLEWVTVFIAFLKEFSYTEGVGLYIAGEGRTRYELLSHIQGATSSHKEANDFGSHSPRFSHITVLAPEDISPPFSVLASVDFMIASCTNSKGLAQLALSLGTPVIPLFQAGLTGCMSKSVASRLFNEDIARLPCALEKRVPRIQELLRQHAELASVWSADVRRGIRADALHLCNASAVVRRLHGLLDHAAEKLNPLLVPSSLVGPMGYQQVCVVAQKAQLVPRRKPSRPFRIAMVTTWLPTRCGIATFAGNMACSLAGAGSHVDIYRLVSDDSALGEVMNVTGNTCHRRVRVRGHILQSNFPHYLETARALNGNGYDVAVLQYEFGVWGGDCGSYALCFLAALHVPSLMVLHTADDGLPSWHHINLYESLRLATATVVMSARTKRNLHAYHGFGALEKATVIPHGVPQINFVTPLDARGKFPELQGRFVLMTNGLINPGKGLHVAVEAISKLLHLPITYVIVGEPHPTCSECKQYYAKVQSMVHSLGIDDRVVFMTKFLDQEELVAVLQMSDVFLLPYLGLTTSNSGTLSMALAAGKCIVATPFEHALAVCEGRCKLVEAGDASALAHALAFLYQTPDACSKMSSAAYAYGSSITWDKIASMYEELIASIA